MTLEEAKATIEKIGAMQEAVGTALTPCPRCGHNRMNERAVRNARSRRASVYICDQCGTDEALLDMTHQEPLPLNEWAATMEATSFPVVVETTINLTQDDIDCIMVTALEGGICYWCSEAEVVEEHLGTYASDQIARGGSVLIHESEEDEAHELNLEKFMNGFKLWFENGGDQYGAIENGELDTSNIDADCADAIIQYALFGEVVYG